MYYNLYAKGTEVSHIYISQNPESNIVNVYIFMAMGIPRKTLIKLHETYLTKYNLTEKETLLIFLIFCSVSNFYFCHHFISSYKSLFLEKICFFNLWKFSIYRELREKLTVRLAATKWFYDNNEILRRVIQESLNSETMSDASNPINKYQHKVKNKN